MFQYSARFRCIYRVWYGMVLLGRFNKIDAFIRNTIDSVAFFQCLHTKISQNSHEVSKDFNNSISSLERVQIYIWKNLFVIFYQRDFFSEVCEMWTIFVNTYTFIQFLSAIYFFISSLTKNIYPICHEMYAILNLLDPKKLFSLFNECSKL